MKRIFTVLLALLLVCGLSAQNYPLTGFSRIDASGIFEITLQKGHEFSVVLDCSDDIKDRIDIHVDGKTLVLAIKDRLASQRSPRRSYANVAVTMPLLTGIVLSGSCSLLCDGRFAVEGGQFSMDLSGAASVKHLRMVASEAVVTLSGASSATIAGRIGRMLADISGSSRLGLTGSFVSLNCQSSGVARFILKDCVIDEMNLVSSGASSLRSDDVSTVKSADFEMTGSTSASLTVTDTLKVEMTGSSCITYSGPESLKIEKQSVSGAAKLLRK